MSSTKRPMNATNAVYTPNGIAEATIISDYNTLDGDDLFKLTSNIPGTNTYNGLNVNFGVISHKQENITQTGQSNTEIQFEFFTTNNFSVRHMYLDLPILVYLAENFWGGSITETLARRNYPVQAIGNKLSYMKKDWSYYSVPAAAITRLFNKIYFKVGGLVDITNTYEQTTYGLGISTMDHMTGMNSSEDLAKNACGDWMSYRGIGNMQNDAIRRIKQSMGDPSLMNGSFNMDANDSTLQPSKFLENFNCLLLDNNYTTQAEFSSLGGLWATRIRIPMASLIPVLQSDMMFGPNIKILIKIELPIWSKNNTLPIDISLDKWNNGVNNYGNLNLIAKSPVIQIAKVDKIDGANTKFEVSNAGFKVVTNEIKTKDCKLGDHSTGLLMCADLSRTPFVEMLYYTLNDRIANNLMKERIYRPMVLNTESLTVSLQDLGVGNTNFMFTVQPNANLPQELFIGIVKTSYAKITTEKYLVSDINELITKYNELPDTENPTGFFSNPIFFFENDPLPLLLQRLEINYGNSPNIDYNKDPYGRNVTKTITDALDGNSAQQQFYPRMYTGMIGNKLPLQNLHNEVMNNNYLDRTLNTSQKLPYADFKKSLDLGEMIPEASCWYRTVLVPDSIQRGGSASDNSAHIINITMQFDTTSPFWSTFQKLVADGDCKIVVIRKTLSQITMDAAGNVNKIDWPAILISGSKPGETQKVTGNPPNGSFQ